jgi:hypothetical protein
MRVLDVKAGADATLLVDLHGTAGPAVDSDVMLVVGKSKYLGAVTAAGAVCNADECVRGLVVDVFDRPVRELVLEAWAAAGKAELRSA